MPETELLDVGERERQRVGCTAEEAPTTAEHDREDHEPVLVDEVVRAQEADQRAAAGEDEFVEVSEEA